ncbi:MAG TPA: carboxypeptidase-like regulatory domain-containing protein, partial [Ferruginibacter sp.]|nr:carboxypeptidase-like regulatory domain-containing protein [Ferruginibacter sp.]
MNTAFGKTLLLLFVLNSFRAYSQAPNLYGTIADADTRAPLAFVSVTIKGSTTGTLTDIDGHFKLRGTAARTTLVISYVGYKTIEFN